MFRFSYGEYACTLRIICGDALEMPSVLKEEESAMLCANVVFGTGIGPDWDRSELATTREQVEIIPP